MDYKLLKKMMEELFPEAVSIEPDADGCCPICKEMGLDLEKDPGTAGELTISISPWKPRQGN